ncbi:hypothetical protein [Ensifer sp. Root558]|uniref:hypothetical protein n=1 Tax=Ensifer sp. Root558 TaxID=1736558 RepID=UPI000713945E|nr:hypothetical protein [Ensifer sp. Root558]KQZ45985.1 hypothetical protein ASD63_12845 [Ensifer sp. Root558]
MHNVAIRDHISEYAAAAALDPDMINGEPGSINRLLRLVLDGTAKLPLDRVAETAGIISCDRHELFRLALGQFYSDGAIAMFESLATPRLCAVEQAWLTAIRDAAGDDLKPPSRIARRVIKSLFCREE